MLREIFPPGDMVDNRRSRVIQLRFIITGQASLACQWLMAMYGKGALTVLVLFLNSCPATEK
jgi:hypothetical protein